MDSHQSDKTHRRLAPEDLILVLACREKLEDEWAQQFARLATGQPDWNRILGKADYHRLLALLHHHLSACSLLDQIPPSSRSTLQDGADEMKRLQGQQVDTLLHCLDLLNSDNIETMALKGPILQSLHPPGAPRASYDLDLLIREADHVACREILEKAGFHQDTPVPKGLTPAGMVEYSQYMEQLRFTRDDLTPVEIHFRLYNYGVPDRRESSWDESHEWTVQGHTIFSLCPEEMLLYLTTHANLHGFGRMLWYYDITAFYRQWGSRMDWDLLCAKAESRRLQASFYHSMLWITQLVYPERTLSELEPLAPTRSRSWLFQRIWRKREFLDLKSFIRPFDAARYYLFGGAPITKKLLYLIRIVMPPVEWLRLQFEPPAPRFPRVKYLQQRRRERKNWNRVTRKSELLG